MELFKNIAIIGVGLIGGSVGLCCKKLGFARVIGVGRNEDRLKKAVSLGAVDGYSLSMEDALADADLVIISTPVASTEPIARQVALYIGPGTVVIDVGSVKGVLPGLLDSIFSKAFFVGCHPIAGKEESGVEAATGDLFAGTKTIVTPTEATDKQAMEKVVAFWELLGSKILVLDAGKHDKMFSVISHLPHMIAYSLINQVEDMKKWDASIVDYSGGGLADYARLGGSSPEMWSDIAALNKDNLVEAMKDYRNILDRLIVMVETEDLAGMDSFFKRSKKTWQDIRKKRID